MVRTRRRLVMVIKFQMVVAKAVVGEGGRTAGGVKVV